MRYAPRQKNKKLIWKIVSIIILVTVCVVAWITQYSARQNEQKEKFSVCNLQSDALLSALNKSYKNTISVKDYLYYGESLDLYEQTYSVENKDTLSGKTVELYNVCSKQSVSMTMENYVDQKIRLDELSAGFYEVYIMDNLVRKRVVFDGDLQKNNYQTIKRNNKVYNIQLIADQSLLKDYEVTLDKPYLFLQVDSVQPDANDIDVLIDPYGMNMDLQTVPDEGNQADGLVENDEMYEAALLLKEELESYGLRVGISKANKDEAGKAYGSDGRLSKGYKQNAKYYLLLRMNAYGNDQARGFELQHSYYVSSTMARGIAYRMHKNLGITLSNMYNGEDEGVVRSSLIQSELDNKNIYDINLYLRESGGRALMAGRFSQTSQSENKDFVNANGMHGLEVDFGYMTNKSDVAYWKQHKKQIVKEFAKAYLEALNIETVD